MDNQTIGFIFLCAVGVCASAWAQHKRMEGYWSRPCMGTQWKHRFPAVAKQDVRKFLNLFVDAFALPISKRLQFEPNDRVLDIYRTINPPSDHWAGDAMECETLVQSMKKEYGVDINPVWREELTLGELFELTQKQKGRGT